MSENNTGKCKRLAKVRGMVKTPENGERIRWQERTRGSFNTLLTAVPVAGGTSCFHVEMKSCMTFPAADQQMVFLMPPVT